MTPTRQEMMVATAAREVRDSELVFVGMRLPLLSFLLAKATHAPEALGLFENGVIRTRAPRELLYTMSDSPNVIGATKTTDMMEVMGLLQSGKVGLGFLGAAQVDRYGNLNTTRVGRTRLPGSGGAADIASLANRFVVLLRHERRRFPDRVDHLTSPGYGKGGDWRKRVGLPRGGPAAVITDLGVLRFQTERKEAELVSYHPGVSPDEIAAETGWPLRFSEDIHETPMPSDEELGVLRNLDPQGFWLGKDK
jgi:glutaconate CoA-transferase subunit B